MARYTGPRSRIARKFGEPIFGPDKYLDRKNFPPGQHGMNKKRKKTSEYGVQLREKQKVKYTYGLLERQFRNFFEKADAATGITGLALLQMLESRLDNVVPRRRGPNKTCRTPARISPPYNSQRKRCEHTFIHPSPR
jgi:small subunit ribosomal protein S4